MSPTSTERRMSQSEIQWAKNVDDVLAEAKKARRPVLIDFTAAPQ
jgi:hypothetical protein